LVRVGVDTKSLDAGLTKAKASSESAGSSISKFGQYAQAGFAIAGAAALKFAIDAVASAQEHERVLTALQVVVGQNTQAFEDQATALQNLTGFQDEEVLAADTVLARFKLTRAEIARTTPLVLDYARATGTDAASAATGLGKALLGNTRALKTIGIDFKATGDRAKDLATITGLLEEKVGGAAEAFGETFAGRVEILKAKFDDLKETLGATLIPAIEAVVSELSQMADAIDAIANHHLPEMNLNVGLLAGALKLIHNPFGDFIADAKQAADVAGVQAIQTATYTGTLKELQTALDVATGAQADQIAASKAAAEALQAEKDAMEDLKGAVPGLIGAVLNLKQAQHDLRNAQNDTTTSALDLKQKELAVVQAFIGVQGAFGDVVDDYKAGHATVQDVIRQFRDQAHAAGLSKDQINDLIGTVRGYISSLNDIPRSVSTVLQLISAGTPAGGPGPHSVPSSPIGGGNGGGNGRGSNITVNVTHYGTPDAGLADVVHAALIQKQRRSGSLQLT
jgi:hypothetical protein